MPRNERFRLYSDEGRFLCRMDVSQRDEKLANEEIAAYRDGFRLLPKPTPTKSSRHESPAAITPEEMQANVGITSGEYGAPPDRNEVRAATVKIRNYPFVFDSKAPTIVAGRGATFVRRLRVPAYQGNCL